jgi:hypothetical protein
MAEWHEPAVVDPVGDAPVRGLEVNSSQLGYPQRVNVLRLATRCRRTVLLWQLLD